MGTYTSADVKCPFYRRDDPKTCSLTCESVLPGGSVKTHFGTKANLMDHIGKYCAESYRTCPWYQIVGHKWAGE